MAKKDTKNNLENQTRQSRKEILRARKQAEQQRNIRLAALGIAGLLLVILLVAIVNEIFIAPERSVATVNGQEISLSDWQERVRFERAQRIISLEDQLQSFNGDIGLVQQFSNQAIVELIGENAEPFAEAILDRMIDEEIIRQGAEERNLLPSEDEVQERIGSIFNYYGGQSPTSTPPPTSTTEPTPSITPITLDGEQSPEEDDGSQESEVQPTNIPLPTPTPVSEEAFQEEFDDLMAQYEDLGVDQDVYQRVIRSAIIAERMLDALAEEENLPDEDMQASFLYSVFNDLQQAEEAQSDISESDFLTVWNTIRSREEDPESEEPQLTASEIQWRTQESIEGGFGTDVGLAAFDLPLQTASEIITLGEGEDSVYLIIYVTGREERPLDPAEFESRKQELLQDYVAEQQLGDIVINELWRSRVPNSPVLDPKFRQPPTPAPELPLNPGGGIEPSVPGGDQTP